MNIIKLTTMGEIDYNVYINANYIVSIAPNTDEPGTIIVTVNDDKYYVKEPIIDIRKMIGA